MNTLTYRHRAGSRRRGITMIEVSLGMIVLLVAVGGVLGSVSSFVLLGDAAREKHLAYMAAQQQLEAMNGEVFAEIFARFNEAPGDDPIDPDPIPGAGFDVLGLEPIAGDADGLPGRILFPLAISTDAILREDFVDADLGMPRDLNADGAIDALDHASDYLLLPVTVRVEWRGASGNQVVELSTTLRND